MDFYFILITFIVLIIVLVLLTLSYLKLKSLPSIDSVPPDPNMVVCSEDDILEAWIRGYPNRQSCPPFTNNYVIDNQFDMFEKFFLVDSKSQCCWYSNEISQRNKFDYPWICNGFESKSPSPNELNIKPYFFDGAKTTFINPSCDNDPNCIALIRAGLYNNFGIDRDSGGIYKITKFRTESTNTYEGGQVPPLDSSADIARKLNLYIGESCQTLDAIYLEDQLILERVEDQYVWYIPAIPDIVEAVFNIFIRDRFYPIAGTNPPLSAAAADYL